MLEAHTNPKKQLKVAELSTLNVPRATATNTRALSPEPLPMPWGDATPAKGARDVLSFSRAALAGSMDPVSRF